MFRAVALLMFAPAAVLAQAGDAESKRPWKITFTPAVEYSLPSDLRTTTGDVSIFRAGAALGVEAPVGQTSALGVNFAWERSVYDWDNATSFGGTNEPWDDINQLDLGVRFMSRIDDKWSYFFGAGVNSSMEDGADFGDSLTYGGGAGVIYRASDKLTLTGGLIVRSQLEDSAFVVPIIGFDWKIDDKWSLTTNYRTSIFPQPGVAIKYQACESVSVALGAHYESRSFRLSDRDTPVDGVGRERRLPVELCVQWEITPHATLAATAGLVAWQRFRMDDSGGTRIAQFEADPTPIFGLAFTLAY